MPKKMLASSVLAVALVVAGCAGPQTPPPGPQATEIQQPAD